MVILSLFFGLRYIEWFFFLACNIEFTIVFIRVPACNFEFSSFWFELHL